MESSVIAAVICILLLPIAAGYGIGWAMRGRRDKRGQHGDAESRRSEDQTEIERDRRQWMVNELERAPLRDVLTAAQRLDLKVHYSFDYDMPSIDEVPLAAAADEETTHDLFPAIPLVTTPAPETLSNVPESTNVAPTTSPDDEPGNSSPASPLIPSRSRQEWDPAVLLLYLGAFLIVAAGIVYASYNWSDLGALTKVGLLAAVTIAFAGSGMALLTYERVRPAAATFVAIGALLVPTNAVAAYTVFAGADARPGMTILLGSLVTMILYGVFSFRPGGWAYRYGTVIAGLLAVSALPPAVGLRGGWGMILLTLAIGISPYLADRLTGRWQRFAKPFVYTSLAVLPFSTLAGIGAISNGTIWFLPASLAAAAMTAGSLALRSRSSIFSGFCSVMGIGAIGGVLIATERSSLDWALVAIGLAFLLILVGERGPSLARATATRALLHIEAIGLFLAAPCFALLAERNWLLSLTLVSGVIGTALIARLRQARWFLLLSGAFAVVAYGTIALYGDGESTSLRRTLFQMPVPVLLAAVSCGLDRKTTRDRTSWGVPIWIVAAITALGITIVPPVSLTTSHGQMAAAIIAAIFAAGSLIAAWSLRMPIVRVAYGLWALYAAGLLIAATPLIRADQTALALVSCLILISASVVWATRNGVPFTTVHAYITRLPELAPILLSTVASLLGVLAITIAYIVGGTSALDEMPSVRWTWVGYLAIHAGIAVLAAWIGYRTRHQDAELNRRVSMASEDEESTDKKARLPDAAHIVRFLPEVALGFGTIAAMLALRMATSDAGIWSWVGIGFGSVLIGLSLLGNQRHPTTDFSRRFLDRMEIVGYAVGAIAILGNLSLEFDSDRDGTDWVQVALYALVGSLLFTAGMLKARPQFSYGAVAALTLAIAFAARGFGADHFTLGLMLLIFAWIIAGTSLILPTSGRWQGQQTTWRYSAFALPFVTMLLTVMSNEPVRSGTRAWQVLVLSMLSLSGMLAIDAWRRQDAIRGMAASALAMIALLMEIAIREPSNIQAYTVPLALYLLGLGWTQRRQASLQDMLLGAGAAILIVPTLLQAMNASGFNWLLLAGGEALALFIVGLILRLRVLIAAGIIAISLIVLRMLVDAVNALPSWMILLVIGLTLLAGGTVMVVWKEALRARIDSLRLRWRAMG